MKETGKKVGRSDHEGERNVHNRPFEVTPGRGFTPACVRESPFRSACPFCVGALRCLSLSLSRRTKLNIPAVKLNFRDARFACAVGAVEDEERFADARRCSRWSLGIEGSKEDGGGRGRTAGMGGVERRSVGSGGTGGDSPMWPKLSRNGESVAPAVEGRFDEREECGLVDEVVEDEAAFDDNSGCDFFMTGECWALLGEGRTVSGEVGEAGISGIGRREPV